MSECIAALLGRYELLGVMYILLGLVLIFHRH
jgi:hypothetical protein